LENQEIQPIAISDVEGLTQATVDATAGGAPHDFTEHANSQASYPN
jgi:hypothetical protein